MQTCRVEEASVLILRPLHRDIAQMFAGCESCFTSPVAYARWTVESVEAVRSHP